MFFAISAVPAQPSAGIGVVEVQKNSRFFAISAALAQPSATFVVRTGPRELSRGSRPGTGGSRVRFLPGPRAVVARCNLHFS